MFTARASQCLSFHQFGRQQIGLLPLPPHFAQAGLFEFGFFLLCLLQACARAGRSAWHASALPARPAPLPALHCPWRHHGGLIPTSHGSQMGITVQTGKPGQQAMHKPRIATCNSNEVGRQLCCSGKVDG
jgi:hypothetical protein